MTWGTAGGAGRGVASGAAGAGTGEGATGTGPTGVGATGTGPTGTGPPPGTLPLIRPAQIPVPGARALPPGQRALLDAPGREFSIVGRTSAGFNPQSFSVNGETAIVITGGVILIVRTLDGSSLIDIEADKLVFWTKGNPQELLGNLSSQRGQRSKELEFYLAGDVQIRSHTGKEDRLLQSDEVYYDVGRNVAIAMHADMEFKQPNIPDPVHMKAEELQMLSCEVDDMSPEYLADAAERLRAAGALDVVLHPVVMKKGRAGTRLEVLCTPRSAHALEASENDPSSTSRMAA